MILSVAPSIIAPIRWTLSDLAFAFLRPGKKAMRLDVRMKRLASPYPRNVHKKPTIPPNNDVLRNLLSDR